MSSCRRQRLGSKGLAQKPAILLLAFLLTTHSIAPLALAEESVLEVPAPETEEPAQEPRQDTEPDSKDIPEEPAEELATKDKDEQSLEKIKATSLEEDDINSSARDSKTKSKSVTVNSSTGAFSYDYLLDLPPGRNGLTPELKLGYSSDNQKNDNLVGYGWELSIPYIETLNRRGVENMYSDKIFSSSLDGELARIDEQEHGARFENGDFRKYIFEENQWIVTAKDGTKYVFGQNFLSRQGDPSDESKTSRWLVNEIRDPNGNFISYEYEKHSGQIYPSQITYTNHSDTAGIFKVEFYWENRPDIYYSYATGYEIFTDQRLARIEVLISNRLERKYELNYESGDNGVRSVLSSIKMSGLSDDNSWTNAPATKFFYSKSAHQWGSWTDLPEDIVSGEDGHLVGEDKGVRFGDINGDGLADVIRSRSGDSQKQYQNTGQDWVEVPSVTQGVFTKGGRDSGLQFLDINGDLLPDLHLRTANNQWDDESIITFSFLNMRNSFTGNGTWTLPEAVTADIDRNNSGKDFGARFADMNGDGLVDMILGAWASRIDLRRIHSNNGEGWTLRTDMQPQDYFILDGQDTGERLVDVNNDGLADMVKRVKIDAGEFESDYRINTGSDWRGNGNWQLPVDLTYGIRYNDPGEDFGVRFFDINGDGLVDIVKAKEGSNKEVYLNTGNTWVRSVEWSLPHVFVDLGGVDQGVRIVDVNGDGLEDLVQRYEIYGGAYHATTYVNEGPKPDLLNKVEIAMGGEVAIKYKPSTQYRDEGQLLNPKLPLVITTVSEIIEKDGLGQEAITKYLYKDGFYYFKNSFDRRFAGFGEVDIIDPLGNLTKNYFYQGNESDTSSGEFEDHPSKINRPYLVEQYDAVGSLFERNVSQWDRAILATEQGFERNFIFLASNVKLTYDGDSSHRDGAETYKYDKFGNITNKENWGEVSANMDGRFSDIGIDKTTQVYSYALNNDIGISSLPKTEEFKNNNGAAVSYKKYYYDDLSSGAVLKGNLTKVEEWVGGTKWIAKSMSYDNRGLLQKVTDPRGGNTSYAYDSLGLYPKSAINTLGQTMSFGYDYLSGQVIEEIDANGFSKIKTYDGLGRPIREQEKAGSGATVTIRDISYQDETIPQSVKVKTSLTANLFTEVYQYFDGLGRLIQERTSMEDADDYAVTSLNYNPQGELATQTLPYTSAGSYYTTPIFSTGITTNFTYDAVGRPQIVVNSLGSTNYTYNDWVTTVTDPLGKVKKYTKDAYGRLVLVDEKYGNGFYNTRYYYSPTGNLIRIIDALNNIRDFTYDNLGRRLTAQDLHQSTDTTFSLWAYYYDDNGNLISRKDPLGQIVNYVYDPLNRPLTEDYIATAGPEVKYIYDNCVNGVGRLCKVAILGLSKNYQYTPRGEVRVDNKVYNQFSYTTVNAYDLAGNLVSKRLPDNMEIIYNYNRSGQIEKISRRDILNGPVLPVVADLDYGPHGLDTYQQNADGIENIFTYDSAKNYQLKNKETKKGSTTYQSVSYLYDAGGNITKEIDLSPNLLTKTVTYTYDDLYRLTKATAVNASSTLYSQNFTYGPTGNILSGPGGSYGYSAVDYTSPQAVTSIASSTYSYDKNGNMLMAPGATFTWDYNDRLVKSITGNLVTTYEYDNEGQRISQKTGTSTTLYISPNYDISGQIIDKHIYAGDRLVATIRSESATSSPYYIHTDHLSGTSLVTDKNSAISELVDYYPYGELRLDQKISTYNQSQKYIGQEYDDFTGLSYLNARYQNGKIGRFLSQDPMFWVLPAELLIDPQQQNSYSYARNNPIGMKDPSGLLTVIIPGTFHNKKSWSKNGQAKDFIEVVGKTFKEEPKIFSWSGENNRPARKEAAQNLNKMIKDYNFKNDEKLNVIAHSHGGNIAILLSKMTKRKIDNLVTLGTPVRADYKPNYDMIGRHANAYSLVDPIQVLGGRAFSVGKIGVAGLFGAYPPTVFSLANKFFVRANNIGVTKGTGFNFINAHSDLWQNSEVWQIIDSKLNK